MPAWRKLGIIAGGGELPVALAEHCAGAGLGYWVARLSGLAAPELGAHPGAEFNLGQMGARLAALRTAGCDALVFVGIVPRPNLAEIDFDERGAGMLAALAAAAPQGDDALLRALMAEHEKDGFRIVGAEEVLKGLAAPAGAIGALAPNASARADIAKAARVAAEMGRLDIGQGAVVCDGLVLAVEAQEGTDEMLRRVAGLPTPIRGEAQARRGVLVKRPKPIQERRIDLPTIGVRTIELAAAAGLAGIAIEAGAALVLRQGAVIEAADAAGLFVYGFTEQDLAGS